MSRWRVTFWIDDTKPDELTIGHKVLELKKKRQFARVVKDGIRLITSLRAGQTDVLFELFPHLEGQLASKSTTTPDSGDLERLADRAAQQAAERVLLHMPSLPATPLVGAPIKPSAAPKIETKAAPIADANAIADNFMMSMGF